MAEPSPISEYIGFGRNATGGAGGSVYTFTRLTDDLLVGSYRYGVEVLTGARIIRPGVSGWIDGSILGDWTDSDGDLTIQGAYGGFRFGLRGAGMRFAADNWIMTNLRIYRGNQAISVDNVGDCLHIDPGVSDWIVDHCSFSFSLDELVTMRGSDGTFQWNTFSHPLIDAGHPEGNHGMAFLAYTGATRGTLRNNLFIHSNERNPVIQDGDWELYNNLVANCFVGTQFMGLSGQYRVNYAGNVIRRGADTINTSDYVRIAPDSDVGNRGYHISQNNESPNKASGVSPAPGNIFTLAEGFENVHTPFSFATNTPEAEFTSEETINALHHFCGAEPFNRDTYQTAVMADTLVNPVTGSEIDSPTEVGGWPTL